MDRPRIGIPLCLDDRGRWRPGRNYAYIDHAYAGAIDRAGGLAVHLPIQSDPSALVAGIDALLLPGGDDFPSDRPLPEGVELDLAPEEQIAFDAALLAATRAEGKPVLGICYGMQMAVIEFARHVAGLDGANSSEIDENSPHPVIDLLPEQRDSDGMGATMRLGSYPCALAEGTVARKVYGSAQIDERHRPRYEFNPEYRERLEEAGMVFSGTSPDGRLVEVVELRAPPFFVASQFHPEFKSRPFEPHPLFEAFVRAAAEQGGEA